MNKQLGFKADVTRCPLKIFLATHWNEDGTCKCHPDRKVAHSSVGKVAKVLEGAYAALEMLSNDELKELERAYAIKSNLQQERQDQGKHMAITLFIRGASEARRS